MRILQDSFLTQNYNRLYITDENRDNTWLFFSSISISLDMQHFNILLSDWPLQGISIRSARRWGWQLWRIFFIHVTCLRARKNTFSRSKLGSNQGNRTSTYVSRLGSSILKFSPSRVYALSLVPFDQDERAIVK